MSEIRSEKLCAGYNKKAVVSDVCLEVKPGKITVLIGPNGAGKSTVLKTAAGMLEPVKGCVYLDGEDISALSNVKRAEKLSVMMTERSGADYASCFDVVSVGRYRFSNVLGVLKQSDIDAVDEAMRSTGTYELRDADFSRISDGQKQRVLLARALVQEPEIMILDEPTGFLDVGYKLEFTDSLKRLVKERNIGVLMSMHELEFAARIADTVVCISERGEIDAIGTAQEIFTGEYIRSLFNVRPGELEKLYSFAERKAPAVKEKADFKIRTGTKFIMVQGTMSGAGKTLVTAGLCRIFKQDGFTVAPFKSQNMALNSYITEDGLEMGRAQVLQAEAAGIKPSVYMNPVLLKPTSDSGSQVIVNGRVLGNMGAREYFEYKKNLVPDILQAVEKLSETAEIIVIEGAGSPAEINLKQNDIVNMGMAEMVDAPVLLVGDIDRGGVFAQLLGTVELLEEDEKKRICGLVVNKFRGDRTILDPGIEMLEERGGIPVAGVIPYTRLRLDDEDSLSERLQGHSTGTLRLGIIRLPRISNFTDFNIFEQTEEIAVNYIDSPAEVEKSDIIIIPGSKNTIGDMRWLRQSGIEAAIKKFSAAGNPVIGICGGYQMLGMKISDPDGSEEGGETDGMGLLPVVTVLENKKHRSQVRGTFTKPTGIFKGLEGKEYTGYEIHMGVTKPTGEEVSEFTSDKSGYCCGNVYGSYVHGLFDSLDAVKGIISLTAKYKGIDLDTEKLMSGAELKERELDTLASVMRQHMDMDLIYRVMGIDINGEK